MSGATPVGSPFAARPVTSSGLPRLIAARSTPVGASSATTRFFAACSMMISIAALSAGRFDFRQFDAFLHDIADPAVQAPEHARKWRAQRLLHLHHFQGEDSGALFESGAHLSQQGDDCPRQGCDDLVLADLLFVITAERI